MAYRLEFRSYQRQFVRSLSTNHGDWNIRKGIIIRLTDDMGKIAWGEIAPLSWFGSETCQQAENFCCQVVGEITENTICTIPDELPACQFGFESAWELLTSEVDFQPPIEIDDRCNSRLLPTGEAALEQVEAFLPLDDRTFKWKIGVAPIEQEIKVFQQLIKMLPSTSKLRLDANGGLTWLEANEWLKMCDSAKANRVGIVEFLEQPLSPDKFELMLELSCKYSTAIALDESVATLTQMQTCYQNGWRGIFVIKPCIAGFPSHLRTFCQKHEIDAVFSSVFESAIGRQAALKLALELSSKNRALGFGVDNWFKDDRENWLENLWNH